MAFNLTEETLIVQNRTHPVMVQINTIAYVLELCYYSMAVVFVLAYIILSKFVSRFHPLLRFQLRIFGLEVLFIIVSRGVGVVFRLIEGASIPLSPLLSTINNVLTTGNLAMVSQVDFSVFLIAMERLLATYKIETYENSFHHPIYRALILFYVIVPPNICSYMGLLVFVQDVFLYNIWNVFTTCTHLVGLVAMETSNILSKRQLRSQDRELSTSFQCKENIMVVKMFRPIFILLFASRLIQFASKYYMFAFQVSFGAIALRIVTHIYNQSVGICMALVPLLLLKNHNNLTRFSRSEVVVNEANGDYYFKTLMQRWER